MIEASCLTCGRKLFESEEMSEYINWRNSNKLCGFCGSDLNLTLITKSVIKKKLEEKKEEETVSDLVEEASMLKEDLIKKVVSGK